MSYSYDAMGRRISKAAQGGTPTQYLYDNLNAVQETIGTAVNPILNGPGVDERYARNDVTGRMYFLTDALGSTIALTDPTGAVREQYSYDPYGNTTLSDTTTGFTNSYQFMGREADSPGLYYYRARYYSPQLPGFISEDPIGFAGGQLSFYAAFASDPIDYVDALGLNPGDPFSTPGAAAVDALNYLRGPTAANSTEYAGLIYKAGNSYYATTPVQGDYDSSTPFNPQAEQQVTNAAGMPVGDYHTHPYIHLVNGKPTPGTEQNTSFLTNCFSDTDIDFSNKAGKIFHPFTAYLGTPKGILTYTPSTGAFGHLNY
jgi:RHS repeat-associated protein